MAEGLLHVISNASVQWSLFSVKSNYPHKKETPCVKARQKSQSCLSREALASFQVLHEHRLTFHVKTSSFTVRPKYTSLTVDVQNALLVSALPKYDINPFQTFPVTLRSRVALARVKMRLETQKQTSFCPEIKIWSFLIYFV